jgi:hypothetical protein
MFRKRYFNGYYPQYNKSSKLVRSVEVPRMDLELFIHVPIQTIILIYTICRECYKNLVNWSFNLTYSQNRGATNLIVILRVLT